MEKGDKKKTPKVKKEKKEKKPKKEKQLKQKQKQTITNKQTVIVGTDQGSKQTIIKKEDARPTTAISHTEKIILDTLIDTPLRKNITTEPYISVAPTKKIINPVSAPTAPSLLVQKPTKITDLTFEEIDKMTKTQIFKNIGDFNFTQLKHVASILGLSQEGRGKMDILDTISKYAKSKVKQSEEEMVQLEIRIEEQRKMRKEKAKIEEMEDIEDIEAEQEEIIVVKKGRGRPRKIFEKLPDLENEIKQDKEIAEDFEANAEETKNELELIKSTIINQDANLDTKEIISSVNIPMFSGNDENINDTFDAERDNAVNNTEPVDEVLDYIMGFRSSSQSGPESAMGRGEATAEWFKSKVYEEPVEEQTSSFQGMMPIKQSSEFEFVRPADPVKREQLVKEDKKAKDLKAEDLDDLTNSEIYDLRKDFNLSQLRHIAENKGIKTSGVILQKRDLLNRLEQYLTQSNLGI